MGLFAAAIPLLLHLLSKRRLPLIPFSTLEFLQKLQKKKARRVQLKQILLLIIRTLAIAAVVLAFARPALQSAGSNGSEASVDVVVVYDDSFNSHAETRDGTIFSLVRKRVHDVLELTEPNDRITVIPLSQPSRMLSVGHGQLEILRDRLDNSRETNFAPDIPSTWANVDSLLKDSPYFNREIFIVSSFYSPEWDSLAMTSEVESERRFILPVGVEKLDNVSIDNVFTENTILRPDKPIDLTATIANHSDKPVKDALVSVYLDGNRIAQAALDLPAEGAIDHSFTIMPGRTGNISGWIKYDNGDALQADDRGFFTLNIPDHIRILAVVQEGINQRILKAAISSEALDFFQVNWVTPQAWESMSLTGYDAVLLSGVKAISGGAADRMVDFVSQGGGLVIFQDRNADLANLSRGFWQKLGFAGAKGVSDNAVITWGKYDLNHPLFRGIFDKSGSPRSPMQNFVVDFAVNKSDHVIIPLANGNPFLIERSVGNGRALLYTTTLDPNAGDFIMTGIFAPLLVRSMAYTVSRSSADDKFYRAGDVCSVLLHRNDVSSLTVETPDDDLLDLAPTPVSGGVEYELGVLQSPGIYEFRNGKDIVHSIAVNSPLRQSSLAQVNLKELSNRIGGRAIINSSEEDLRSRIIKMRFGRELWAHFAGLFLILLIAESIISRIWKKEE